MFNIYVSWLDVFCFGQRCVAQFTVAPHSSVKLLLDSTFYTCANIYNPITHIENYTVSLFKSSSSVWMSLLLGRRLRVSYFSSLAVFTPMWLFLWVPEQCAGVGGPSGRCCNSAVMFRWTGEDMGRLQGGEKADGKMTQQLGVPIHRKETVCA